MANRVRITDRDKGWKALMRRAQKAARGRAVTVGVHSGEGGAPAGGGSLSVADVATIHEYGLGNSPERSFVRAFADEKRDEANEVEAKLVGAAIMGKGGSIDDALERFGTWLVGMMQKRIRAGIQPGNAPATEAAKGSSTPLIDTGQLVSSITYKVE